ncbi:hypothetical protein QUF80_22145, partial [Desulfococcaceae bacterium HSG8]|nr:hypothetical protein [Desulfococcaceae bacterium HSG8]
YQPNVKKTDPDLRKNFHEELEKLKKEKKSLRGMVSHLTGKMAEYQLATAFRSRKRFSPSRYFSDVRDDTKLNITDVRMRVKFQRPDGKEMEMDVLAESDCGRLMAVEVKKTQTTTGLTLIKDFMEKIAVYAALHPEKQMVPAFFSAGGFTGEALEFCRKNGIATAQEISVF